MILVTLRGIVEEIFSSGAELVLKKLDGKMYWKMKKILKFYWGMLLVS